MRIIQICETVGQGVDGCSKPIRDISKTISALGIEKFRIKRYSSHNRILQNVFRLVWWFQAKIYAWKLPADAFVILQYPGEFFTGRLGFWLINEKLLRRKRLHLIVIVHDLNSQRFGDLWHKGALSQSESRILNMAELIVVHCNEMAEWLESKGVNRRKMIPLGIFDYLHDYGFLTGMGKDDGVAIAGNLSANMCAFLSQLKHIKDVDWNLYGAGFNEEDCFGDNVHYKGCFSPEELPTKIRAGFGLAWYGDSTDTITDPWGAYLKIIFVHKLSFYLSIGLPVIIWDGSAMSKFVLSEGVGLVVGSLNEIGQRIRSLTESEYDAICANARRIGAKLKAGYYTRTVFGEVFNRLQMI